MTTHHRGLPPPAALTLPDPSRPSALPHEARPGHPHPYSSIQSTYQPPSEDSVVSLNAVRAEEEKRRQEEEKTKQEDLRLRQREIEIMMLRDAINGGVPPQLIPVIFAGLSGGPLAGTNMEYAQQAFAQFLQSAQPQPGVRPPSPLRKDLQSVSQQAFLPSQALSQTVSGQILPSQPHQSAYPSPAYASPRSSARATYGPIHQQYSSGPTSAPQNTAHALSSLPRLTTNEVAPVAPATYGAPPQPHQLASHVADSAPSPSASISFHHWQPPAEQSGGSKGSKDSTKTSPKSLEQLNSQDQSTPRKRKAQGLHEAAPPPAARQSPAFSTVSTVSNKSRRVNHAGRRNSGDSVGGRAYDPIGHDRRSRREGSGSQEEAIERGSRVASSRPESPPPPRQAEHPPTKVD